MTDEIDTDEIKDLKELKEALNPESDENDPSLDSAIAAGMGEMISPEDVRTLTRLKDHEVDGIAIELAVCKEMAIGFPINMINENLNLRISTKDGKGRSEVIEMVQAVKKEKEKRKKRFKLF